jgi:hypothetical protein
LLVWLYQQAGQPQEALPFLDDALASGIGTGAIAANYVGWAQGNPPERHRVPGLLSAAIDAGWSIDAFSTAQQLANQGDTEGSWLALTHARRESAMAAEQRWRELLADVQSSRGKIEANVQVSEQARTEALESIHAAERHINDEAERIRELVKDVSAVIQGASAHQLANDYAMRAESARNTARWWTIATLVVGALAIALGAAFVLVGVHQNHDPSEILTKAGISLPLLGVAAYLNKLGSEERRDARTLRHVELQIRTAQPYLANLPEETRDNVQAALALRFFPGQSQNPHGEGVPQDPDDAVALVRELTRKQAT